MPIGMKAISKNFPGRLIAITSGKFKSEPVRFTRVRPGETLLRDAAA